MKELFKEWKPNKSSRERLAVIGGVLEEYVADNITLTLRQLFYQLVTKNVILNTPQEYNKLGELLSKARLAGLVDWSAIEDRVRQAVEWQHFDNIQQCADRAARQFTLDRWKDQPNYVELWSSVIQPICSEHFNVLMVNRGYSSSSAMYESRNRIERNARGRDVTILYLGDLDPSGEDMVRDIEDRLETFNVSNFLVEKLALNIDQVRHFKLPHNSVKSADSRSPGFVAKYGSKCYEVDAIPPKALQKMIREAIQSHMDMDAYEAIKLREQVLRSKLVKAVKGIK